MHFLIIVFLLYFYQILSKSVTMGPVDNKLALAQVVTSHQWNTGHYVNQLCRAI